MVNNVESKILNKSTKSNAEKALVKILITGVNGYVGSNLRNFFKEAGYDVYGITSKLAHEEKIYQLDMYDSEKIFSVLGSVLPDVVVHTAALSSLNLCEKIPELAMKVNVEATRNLINAIRKVPLDLKLVFFSSDYVFDGERGNYTEKDEVNPQTVYGKTKAMSEADVKEYLNNYIICRTANVYGRGGNFFNFILGALKHNKVVEIFDDTFYTPTYIDYLIDSLKALLEADFKGVIHVAGPQRLSRYDFAEKMVETLGKEKTLVQPVKASDKLIAKDSSLNCEYSRKILRNYWPSTEESLQFCWGNLITPYCYSIDERGGLTGVFQGLKWEEINCVESIAGSVRGKHYHEATTEGFFIINGKIRVTLLDVLTGSRRVFIVQKGNIMLIKPNTVHTFEMLENSRWINMLSKPLNNKIKDIHGIAQN